MEGLSQGLTYKVRGYFATTLPCSHHYHRHTHHFWGPTVTISSIPHKVKNFKHDMENKDDIPLLSLKYISGLKCLTIIHLFQVVQLEIDRTRTCKNECSTGLKQSSLVYRSMIIKKNRSNIRDSHWIVIG